MKSIGKEIQSKEILGEDIYGQSGSRETPRVVRILARKFARGSMDEEDLIQEGMLAYMKARSTFVAGRDAKFDTYVSRVITNRFIDLFRKTQGKDKSAQLDESTTVGAGSFDDMVDLIEIGEALEKHVPPLERAIFKSYVEGFSYEEIGKIFDLNRKKIDNVVQKVKKTIKARM